MNLGGDVLFLFRDEGSDQHGAVICGGKALSGILMVLTFTPMTATVHGEQSVLKEFDVSDGIEAVACYRNAALYGEVRILLPF